MYSGVLISAQSTWIRGCVYFCYPLPCVPAVHVQHILHLPQEESVCKYKYDGNTDGESLKEYKTLMVFKVILIFLKISLSIM